MNKRRMLKVSMNRADEALTRVSEMAKRFKCGVVVSFPERPDLRTDVMFIAAVALDSEGREVCLYGYNLRVSAVIFLYVKQTCSALFGVLFLTHSYRKRHLWKGAYENSMFTAGEEGPTAFCLRGIRLGLGNPLTYPRARVQIKI